MTARLTGNTTAHESWRNRTFHSASPQGCSLTSKRTHTNTHTHVGFVTHESHLVSVIPSPTPTKGKASVFCNKA